MSFSKVYVEKSTKNIESGDIFFYETGYICSDSKGNIIYIFAKSLKWFEYYKQLAFDF